MIQLRLHRWLLATGGGRAWCAEVRRIGHLRTVNVNTRRHGYMVVLTVERDTSKSADTGQQN